MFTNLLPTTGEMLLFLIERRFAPLKLRPVKAICHSENPSGEGNTGEG
ncbi:MAG: hypothetical protein KAJ08_01565 [Deltaproteobacteria bacterium]|nr:hypothetical protein [Deltaproteobacteria bacterium]